MSRKRRHHNRSGGHGHSHTHSHAKGGVMSSLRGGFRSTVRGGAKVATGSRKGWLSTVLTVALLAVALYFVLRRFGVLH
jgi:hypothetical protein